MILVCKELLEERNAHCRMELLLDGAFSPPLSQHGSTSTWCFLGIPRERMLLPHRTARRCIVWYTCDQSCCCHKGCIVCNIPVKTSEDPFHICYPQPMFEEAAEQEMDRKERQTLPPPPPAASFPISNKNDGLLASTP